MGLEALSDDDLMALKSGDLGKVSDAGLQQLKQPSAPVAPKQPELEKAQANPIRYAFDKSMIGHILNGASFINDKIVQGADYAGGKVTDTLANAGASPEVAAGAGYATNVGLQAIPALAGSGLGKAAQPVMEGAAETVMRNAIKTNFPATKSGNADKAARTLLDEGVNATAGGMQKLQDRISDLNGQVESIIAGSNKTIDKGMVAGKIQDVVNNIERKNSRPQDALRDVEKVYTQFMQNQIIPKDIPIQQAQELKKGIYQMLKQKYSPLVPVSDADRADMAIARGYREGIATAEPSVRPLTAKESDLMNALKITERHALMEVQKDIPGFAALTGNPTAFGAYMTGKSALFKSLVARMLNSSSDKLPIVVGGGIAVGNNNNQQ